MRVLNDYEDGEILIDDEKAAESNSFKKIYFSMDFNPFTIMREL